MHFFYFDESGTPTLKRKWLETTTAPWFVLTAAGFPSEQWLDINSRITAIKSKYFPGWNPWDIEIKSVYIRSWGTDRSKPPWSHLEKENLDALVEDCYAIYTDFDITLWSVAIDQPSHVLKYGNRARHPYEYAFTNILERADLFLQRSPGRVGLCFLDEYKPLQRQVISRYAWYRREGTWVKTAIKNIVEPPQFVSSHASQMICLPDIAGYNVYHAYNYKKSDYKFFQRITPLFDRKPNSERFQGYGLKVLPTQKMPGLSTGQ